MTFQRRMPSLHKWQWNAMTRRKQLNRSSVTVISSQFPRPDTESRYTSTSWKWKTFFSGDTRCPKNQCEKRCVKALYRVWNVDGTSLTRTRRTNFLLHFHLCLSSGTKTRKEIGVKRNSETEKNGWCCKTHHINAWFEDHLTSRYHEDISTVSEVWMCALSWNVFVN